MEKGEYKEYLEKRAKELGETLIKTIEAIDKKVEKREEVEKEIFQVECLLKNLDNEEI